MSLLSLFVVCFVAAFIAALIGYFAGSAVARGHSRDEFRICLLYHEKERCIRGVRP